MKRKIAALAAGGLLLTAAVITALSQDRNPSAADRVVRRFDEYASVRFMQEKTSIVWPDGKVENVMELVGTTKFPGGERYPKGADYRMYWLTMAMNIMAKKGYEFVHMNDADVIMRRAVSQ